LKRGSMKFWLCVSLALAMPGPAVQSKLSAPQKSAQPSAHRANETSIAGLRPGRDTFAIAEKRLKSKNLAASEDPAYREWHDGCSGRAIRVELDAKSVIQSITITSLDEQTGECSDKRGEFLDPRNWVTGLGLHIGDSQDRILAVYGEPNSSGPASKNGKELALMYYQFDWAGSDVPQVMEVLCARETGRVVEITLAFPSL
jgi:hypothetical protein